MLRFTNHCDRIEEIPVQSTWFIYSFKIENGKDKKEKNDIMSKYY